MLTGRYLVLIEDDAIMGHSLLQRLELEGAEVTWVKQAARGIAAVRTPRRPVDAVICDIRLPDGTGEEVFAAVSRRLAPPPFLFITGQGEIDQAVRLLRGGGADYLTKPFEMTALLDRLVQVLRPEHDAAVTAQTGISALARQVDALVIEFAAQDRPVLIQGERGLGKARLARRLHDLSDRRAAPFVTVNAFRDDLTTAELVAGIDAAGEGSLFVNGLGRVGAGGQALLMECLGRAPFRLLASCGTRIGEKAAAGAFRADLLYTLLGNEIVLPPLSERREDAVWFAGEVFEAANRARATPLRGLSDLALVAIRDHDWPGNGREVRSRLLRAVDSASGQWVHPADVFPELALAGSDIGSLAEARDTAERRQILMALDRTGGQVSEAARLLKVSRTTLWEKMQKFGL